MAATAAASFEAHLPDYIMTATFPNRDLALEKLNQFGADSGFQLAIRTSEATTTYVCCRRARSSRAARPDSGTYTSCTRCPYSVKICTSPLRRDSVVVRIINPLHNHAPMPEGFVAHASRPAKRTRRRETTPPPPPSPPPPRTSPPAQPAIPSSPLGSTTVDGTEAGTARWTPKGSLPCSPDELLNADTDDGNEPSDATSTVVDASTASHLSRSTAASAVRGLLSLSFPSAAPSPPSRKPATTAGALTVPRSLSSSSSLASSSDPTVLLAMLRHPPSNLMDAVAKLSYVEAQQTLEGVRILAAMLEIQERLKKPRP